MRTGTSVFEYGQWPWMGTERFPKSQTADAVVDSRSTGRADSRQAAEGDTVSISDEARRIARAKLEYDTEIASLSYEKHQSFLMDDGTAVTIDKAERTTGSKAAESVFRITTTRPDSAAEIAYYEAAGTASTDDGAQDPSADAATSVYGEDIQILVQKFAAQLADGSLDVMEVIFSAMAARQKIWLSSAEKTREMEKELNARREFREEAFARVASADEKSASGDTLLATASVQAAHVSSRKEDSPSDERGLPSSLNDVMANAARRAQNAEAVDRKQERQGRRSINAYARFDFGSGPMGSVSKSI